MFVLLFHCHKSSYTLFIAISLPVNIYISFHLLWRHHACVQPEKYSRRNTFGAWKIILAQRMMLEWYVHKGKYERRAKGKTNLPKSLRERDYYYYFRWNWCMRLDAVRNAKQRIELWASAVKPHWPKWHLILLNEVMWLCCARGLSMRQSMRVCVTSRDCFAFAFFSFLIKRKIAYQKPTIYWQLLAVLCVVCGESFSISPTSRSVTTMRPKTKTQRWFDGKIMRNFWHYAFCSTNIVNILIN